MIPNTKIQPKLTISSIDSHGQIGLLKHRQYNIKDNTKIVCQPNLGLWRLVKILSTMKPNIPKRKIIGKNQKCPQTFSLGTKNILKAEYKSRLTESFR